MKPYPSYKDSGVEWIGEIPNGWMTSKIKFHTSIISKGTTPTTIGQEIKTDGIIRFIKGENITDKGLEFNSEYYIDEETNNLLNRSQLKENDILFVIAGTIGKCCILKKEHLPSNTSQAISFIRLKLSENHNFILYLLKSDMVKIQFDILIVKSAQPNLSMEDLSNLCITYPPINEQHHIVSYLDEKTSLIDTLIQSKQKKITLLKEKRTSLINHIVTKGLNPNVEMKDSGVEWIGEIPKGWECVSGSVLGSYGKGKGIKKDEVVESGLPCIRYGEIYTTYNHTVYETVSYITDETTNTSLSTEKGTLLITGSGETKEEIGKCAVWMGNENVWVSGDIITLKPSPITTSEYLCYTINSECVRVQRELYGRGEIIVHIYSKNFKEMKFPLPPLSEQQQIVQFLDEETSLIDKTITIEERKIELLKEYKQSLISVVVTGKICVLEDG